MTQMNLNDVTIDDLYKIMNILIESCQKTDQDADDYRFRKSYVEHIKMVSNAIENYYFPT